ncbi:hypothetical protein ROZALSC1DRAFT_27965, partial [Rozella allomycis CSF55]
MSRELEMYDVNGLNYASKMLYHFLPELFNRWKEINANHLVTVVLCGRLNGNKKYKDIYKVVFEWESTSDWSSFLMTIRTGVFQFWEEVFTRKIIEGSLYIDYEISSTINGCILEATNLALNIYDKHYIDRDFSKTGLSIVYVTAGNGYFEVERDLFAITKRRLVDAGIGLDVVCLAKTPLFTPPLFKINLNDGRFNYAIPHWIDCSFYDQNKLKNDFRYSLDQLEEYIQGDEDDSDLLNKIPTLESTFEENVEKNKAFINNSQDTKEIDYDLFDELLFKENNVRTPAFSIHEISFKSKRSFLSEIDEISSNLSQTSPSYNSISKAVPINSLGRIVSYNLQFSSPESPSKSPMKRFLVNPMNPTPVNKTMSSYRRRWQFAFPQSIDPRNSISVTKWKSLTKPACFPLTTDFLPSIDQLSDEYKEYTYTIYPNDENIFLSGYRTSISNLLEELVGQRLSQGFQLIEKFYENSEERNSSTPTLGISKIIDDGQWHTYFVSLGDQVHQLSLNGGENIEVKRFVKKNKKVYGNQIYEFNILYNNRAFHEERCVNFSQPSITNYNWNYLDHLIAGYHNDLTETLKYWRSRFILIPLAALPHSLLGRESLNDEELRLNGFFKFIQIFKKYKINNEQTKSLAQAKNFEILADLGIAISTFRLSAYVSSESGTLESQNFNDFNESVTKDITVHEVASLMQHPTLGVSIKDRRWHWWLHKRVFTGSEFIDWALKSFKDISTREEALAYGNVLIEKGLFEHVSQSHLLIDGHNFYRLNHEFDQVAFNSTLIQGSQDKEKGDRGVVRWFNKFVSSKSRMENETQRRKIVCSRKIFIDIDPLKKTNRMEWAVLHYDAAHNPKICYHFTLNWLVCTAKLMEDMIKSMTQKAYQCGFALVEAPAESIQQTNNRNPFHAPLQIKLSCAPPSYKEISAKINLKIPPTYFEEELVKKFDFILDLEADERFPTQVERIFSYERSPVEYTQYVHRSGEVFVQLVGNGQPILWTENRLFISKQKTKPKCANLFNELSEFCSNQSALTEFWNERV